MWYKQLPQNSDGIEAYRAGATVLLFAVNGIVIASFLIVSLWYLVKQKSKHIVQWLPFTLPFFETVVHAEEELRWPYGTDLLPSERLDIREDWTYFAALREGRLFGRGAAFKARRKVAKLAARLHDALLALSARRKRQQGESEEVAISTAPSGVIPPNGTPSSRGEEANAAERGGVPIESFTGAVAHDRLNPLSAIPRFAM